MTDKTAERHQDGDRVLVSTDIQYARVGGPPDDWNGLVVWDLARDEEIKEVREVNVAEGWVRRYTLARDRAGNVKTTIGGRMQTEIIDDLQLELRTVWKTDHG